MIFEVHSGDIIPLGKAGENDAVTVVFDVERILSEYGDAGTFRLLNRRAGEDGEYPAGITRKGDKIHWTVGAMDNACPGRGECELQYYFGNTILKSESWDTRVLPAIGTRTEAPAFWTTWEEQILSAQANAEGAEKKAQQAVQDAASAARDAEAVRKMAAEGKLDGKPGYTPQKGIDYFDGEPGDKGDPFRYEDFTPEQLEGLKVKGDPGYTPVKGVDYYTEAEKEEWKTFDINPEVTAAKAEIIAQGEATRATIPAEYTELSDRVSSLDGAVFDRDIFRFECADDVSIYSGGLNSANASILLMYGGANGLFEFNAGDKITDFKLKNYRTAGATLCAAVLINPSGLSFDVASVTEISPTKIENGFAYYDLSGVPFEQNSRLAFWTKETSYFYTATEQPPVGYTVSLYRSTVLPTVGASITYNQVYSNSRYMGYAYTVERKTDRVQYAVNLSERNAELVYKEPTAWIEKAESLKAEQGRKFTFGIQTDIHYDLTMSRDFGKNLAKLSHYFGFDFIANLGDLIRGYATDGIDNTELMRQAFTELVSNYVDYARCPVLLTLGNHENNKMWATAQGDMSLVITEDEQYAHSIAISKHTAKSVFDGRSIYYYTDFDDAGIRVIMLYSYDGGSFRVSQEQINWLTCLALNTDKAVIVMTHCPLLSEFDTNNVTNASEVVSAVEAFKQRGGDVIGFFYGHTHKRESFVHNGIPHITFRDGGVFAEIVMVDTNNRTIKMSMVGTVLDDREFSY